MKIITLRKDRQSGYARGAGTGEIRCCIKDRVTGVCGRTCVSRGVGSRWWTVCPADLCLAGRPCIVGAGAGQKHGGG